MIGMLLIVAVNFKHLPFIRNTRTSFARTGFWGLLVSQLQLHCNSLLYYLLGDFVNSSLGIMILLVEQSVSWIQATSVLRYEPWGTPWYVVSKVISSFSAEFRFHGGSQPYKMWMEISSLCYLCHLRAYTLSV